MAENLVKDLGLLKAEAFLKNAVECLEETIAETTGEDLLSELRQFKEHIAQVARDIHNYRLYDIFPTPEGS